jgi:hypothetical protein
MGFIGDITRAFGGGDAGDSVDDKMNPKKIGEEIGEYLKEELLGPIIDGFQPLINFVKDIIAKVDEIRFYMNCSIEKVQNFWTCFIWYILLIFQETLNIIIIAICEITVSLIGFDLKRLYLQGLDFIGKLSDILESYTGMTLLFFPYSDTINEKCFTCEKMKGPSKMAQLKQDIKDSVNYVRTQVKDTVKSNVSFFQEQIDDITT